MLSELLSDLRYRMRALLRPGVVERELDQELRFHIEREAEKHIRTGVPPEEAMRRARVDFGGVDATKEASRDGRGLGWLEILRQDLRYSLRSLGRSPGFTTGVMLTLALGIGANAVMFGIVDQMIFRTPAYLRAPEQVNRVYVSWIDRGERTVEMTYQYTRYLDLQKFTHSFSSWAAFSNRPLAVGLGPETRELEIGTVSATYFDFFDAPPAIGRFFLPVEDTVPLGATVAVLGYGFWQSQFGGRSDVLGQQLKIGGVGYTIIGVAPRNFDGLADDAAPVAYVPITTYAGTWLDGRRLSTYWNRYNWGWMQAIARRKPDVSVAQATADLSQAMAKSWELEAALSAELPPVTVAQPNALAGPVQLEAGPRQSKLSKVARWVWGVSAVVLLIACANVANLLLARSVRRRREIALRLALGVGRRRLIGQLLTESLLLAGIGGGAGLLLAHWGGTVLRRLFLPEYATGSSLVDIRILAFALSATVAAGMMTGLAPALQARRADVSEDLKSGARDSGGRRSRMRTALLLLQATLSVVLLVGAGLFVMSLQRVRGVRLGYDVDQVLYIPSNTRGAKLDEASRIALSQRLLEAARTVPGVESAALGLTVPFWDTWSESLFVDGIDSTRRLGSFSLQGASPGFFSTLGTRILRGRGVGSEDRKDAPRVIVVSEAMGNALWPGKNPIGQCIRLEADTMPCTTVVGIAENIRQNSLISDDGLNYYLPLEQYHPEDAVLFVRVRGHAGDLKETLRRQLQPIMPGDAYLNVTPMTEIVGPEVRSWELGATMFLAFGGLALVLAAIGLYSVIAYDVVQRTRELGIRIALGARAEDVVQLVARDGMRFALAGILLGGGIALAAGRWIGPLLYGVSPRDPLIFGVVAGVLLVVSGIASALPALRATRVDPSVTLRTE